MNTPYKMKEPSLLKMVSALKSKPTKDKVKKKKTTGGRGRGGYSRNLSDNKHGTNPPRSRTTNTPKSGLTGMVGGKKVTVNNEQLKNMGIE